MLMMIRYLLFVDFPNSFLASSTFLWKMFAQSSMNVPLKEYFTFLSLNRVSPLLMTVSA